MNPQVEIVPSDAATEQTSLEQHASQGGNSLQDQQQH